jgi:hypothetical protein
LSAIVNLCLTECKVAPAAMTGGLQIVGVAGPKAQKPDDFQNDAVVGPSRRREW